MAAFAGPLLLLPSNCLAGVLLACPSPRPPSGCHPPGPPTPTPPHTHTACSCPPLCSPLPCAPRPAPQRRQRTRLRQAARAAVLQQLARQPWTQTSLLPMARLQRRRPKGRRGQRRPSPSPPASQVGVEAGSLAAPPESFPADSTRGSCSFGPTRLLPYLPAPLPTHNPTPTDIAQRNLCHFLYMFSPLLPQWTTLRAWPPRSASTSPSPRGSASSPSAPRPRVRPSQPCPLSLRACVPAPVRGPPGAPGTAMSSPSLFGSSCGCCGQLMGPGSACRPPPYHSGLFLPATLLCRLCGAQRHPARCRGGGIPVPRGQASGGCPCGGRRRCARRARRGGGCRRRCRRAASPGAFRVHSLLSSRPGGFLRQALKAGRARATGSGPGKPPDVRCSALETHMQLAPWV